MDYKYEFERLLEMAKQVLDNTNFDKREVSSFASLRALRNAVNFYGPSNTKLNPKQAKWCPKHKECIEFGVVYCSEQCEYFTPEG